MENCMPRPTPSLSAHCKKILALPLPDGYPFNDPIGYLSTPLPGYGSPIDTLFQHLFITLYDSPIVTIILTLIELLYAKIDQGSEKLDFWGGFPSLLP